MSLADTVWQPEFNGWAFNLPRGFMLRAKWERIPAVTDVLVTHGPPAGVLDRTDQRDQTQAGCVDLRAAVERVEPKVHVFGHIHEGYGTAMLGPTLCINAAICTREYRPTNKPIVVDLVDGVATCR